MAPEAVERRLAAIMFTDIVGYTALMARDEDAARAARDQHEAFAWLERGYRERDPLMTVLDLHPFFDPLRSDPRFQDLLRRIGFPES